jgi:hypothetical protein
MHLRFADRKGDGEVAPKLSRSLVSQHQRGHTNGDNDVTFHLKQPQPALISLLASGYSPIYPCHVSGRDMRSHPIGTGPFKFVEYKPSQSIKVARNPDYWKPGRPYLDGIEYTIIPNRLTAILAFVAGKFDMTFPYEVSIPLVKDVRSQSPQATCEVNPMNGRANLLITNAPPFGNPVLRRAMQLSLDRKSFIDILGEGQYDIGAVLQPPPEGIWGMPLCCAWARAAASAAGALLRLLRLGSSVASAAARCCACCRAAALEANHVILLYRASNRNRRHLPTLPDLMPHLAAAPRALSVTRSSMIEPRGQLCTASPSAITS